MHLHLLQGVLTLYFAEVAKKIIINYKHFNLLISLSFIILMIFVTLAK